MLIPLTQKTIVKWFVGQHKPRALTGAILKSLISKKCSILCLMSLI